MIFDVLRALVRRWYVVLLGLLVSAGLVYGAVRLNPPQYDTTALVLFLPSGSQVGVGGNPFLELSGLEQPASIVAAYFSSATVEAEVAQVSETAHFEVNLDDSTRGPVLAVEVTDKSSRGAQVALNHLLARIPEELKRLQEDVHAPPEALIGSMILTVDQQPKLAMAGVVRSMVAVSLVGVIGTGIATYAFDGLVKRRKLHRADGGGGGRSHDSGEVPSAAKGDHEPAELEQGLDPSADPEHREGRAKPTSTETPPKSPPRPR